MLTIRNNARIVRKYALSNGVLCASCYCEDKCYLRINVVLKTGEFTDVYSCINLQEAQRTPLERAYLRTIRALFRIVNIARVRIRNYNKRFKRRKTHVSYKGFSNSQSRARKKRPITIVNIRPIVNKIFIHL